MDSNKHVILQGCIEDFRESNSLGDMNDSDLFEIFSLCQIMKKYNGLSFENISDSITDAGNDGGIDSIVCTVNEEPVESFDPADITISRHCRIRLLISQCKKEKTFKEGVIDKLIVSIPELFDFEKTDEELLHRFNPKIVERADMAKQLWKRGAIKGASMALELNYCCIAAEKMVSSSFMAKRNQLKKICGKTFNIEEPGFTLIDSTDLIKFYQSHPVTRLTLPFKESPVSTSYIGKEALGYVGMVMLNDYKRFITDEEGSIREELFEQNIRHWQGEERDVNKKIRNTLQSIDNRDFWWLNNGITIIAEDSTQVGKELFLENVQIVNGLQTSYSIYRSLPGDEKDLRSVLVKVIINSDKEIIDNIIESTNYQNAVRPSDLRASDPLQREIEQFFLTKDYYFDRRKNYYKNLGKPMGRIFGLLSMAQAIKAIVFTEPDSARAQPTALVKSDGSYNRLFKAEDDFNGYLNCCLIVAKTHSEILALADKKEKSQFSNFKLHLAMAIATDMVRKTEITNGDIANLNLDEIDFHEKFQKAIEILRKAIEEYSMQNNGNIITMAKSAEFTAFLKEKIKDSII